jgi:hypothetical protein
MSYDCTTSQAGNLYLSNGSIDPANWVGGVVPAPGLKVSLTFPMQVTGTHTITVAILDWNAGSGTAGKLVLNGPCNFTINATTSITINASDTTLSGGDSIMAGTGGGQSSLTITCPSISRPDTSGAFIFEGDGGPTGFEFVVVINSTGTLTNFMIFEGNDQGQ